MMREIIAEKLGFPLQDFYRKTNILETLQFYKETQNWDEDKLRNLQETKLKTLVNFAYKNVPYYEDLFNKIKLRPSDISTLDDLYKIPILTKKIALKNNSKLFVRNHKRIKNLRLGKTGGTTGIPLLVLKDANARSHTWASYYRWFEWMGLNYWDKKATLWGASTVLSNSVKSSIMSNSIDFLQNQITINSFSIDKSNYLKTFNHIKEFNPLILKGYLSSLIDLAEFIVRNDLKGISPIAISSTSETLLSHNREYLEQVFGAPVYDQYGCGEVSGIAYECSAHNGLHITEEHCIVETSENKNDLSGRSGNLVVTNLDNFAMPFLRYENGDVVALSDDKCSCGLKHKKISRIEGRTADTITLKNGTKVHGVFFTDIFYELNILSDKVQRFQVYQEKVGEIELRIEGETSLEPEKKKLLIDSLNRFFDSIIYIEQTLIQTETNGKFKYIISNILK